MVTLSGNLYIGMSGLSPMLTWMEPNAYPMRLLLISINMVVFPWQIMWHSELSWWRHQMEKFPRYWPFLRGIHRWPVNSPHKGQWRGALMFSLICVWIKGWVNNREAADLRRYRAHYDVTVVSPLAVLFNLRQVIYVCIHIHISASLPIYCRIYEICAQLYRALFCCSI